MVSWGLTHWIIFLFIILIVLQILEAFSTRFFIMPFFKWGIPWFKKTIATDISNYKFPELEKVQKTEALFLFKKNKIYFRSKKFWFKFLRINSILSFKAYCIVNSKNEIEIIGKLPVMIILLKIILFVLILSIIDRLDSLAIEIGFIIFTLFILTMNTVKFLSLEKERFEKCTEELLEILKSHK